MRLLSLLMICAVWATMIVWWFWEYLKALLNREPGESYLKALQRGNHERSLNQQARTQMLGGRLVTSVATIACLALMMLTALWMLQGRPIGYVCGIYIVVGFALTARLNLKAHRNWARLTVFDRLLLRWTHAWLWPIHLLTKHRRPPN